MTVIRPSTDELIAIDGQRRGAILASAARNPALRPVERFLVQRCAARAYASARWWHFQDGDPYEALG